MLLVFLGAAGQVLNIYAQVGLVMLIGLAGGNAILIVDLANQKMGEGESALEAAKFSAKSRLRPILMTAISSLTGFLPLMLASGAGAQSQSSLGLVVFGGLLVATFLSTLVVPVFYVVMKSLLGQADAKPPEGGDGDGGQNAQSGSSHSPTQLMPNSNNELDTRKPFSGSRALVALAIGCAIGAAVAYFLKVLIENTPAEIDVLRLRLFYLMVITFWWARWFCDRVDAPTSGGCNGSVVSPSKSPAHETLSFVVGFINIQ